MRRLNVLLAPGGPLISVLSILQDWSAAGLIEEFVWMEPETLTPYDANVLRVRGGTLHGGTLRNFVADTNPDQAALAVLVPRLDDATVVAAETEQSVAQLLDGVCGSATLRMRCVVTRTGVTRSAAEIARDGWHNVVLSPEERSRPGGPAVAISDATDSRQLGVHAALGVAGLLGLWSGLDANPAVTGPPQAGRSARLASAYVRRLRAGNIESRLRHAVLATDVSLPRPRRLGASDVYLPEPERATMAMADAWWRVHRGDLVQPRESVPADEPRPTGLFEALREFFTFLWTAMRNAPGQWFENKRRQLAAGVARRVTSAVYGAGSAYTVVVSGMTGDGLPVGWLEAGRAVGEVEAALDAANLGVAQEAQGEMGGLWADFIAGALTLADGAARVEGLPPVPVDAGVGIVRNVGQIAPSDADSFTDISGQLSAVVDIHTVLPADVLSRFDLQRRLAAVRDPDLQLDVREAGESLRHWQASTQTTYAVRVAEHVGKAQLDTRAEIAQLLASMDESGSQELERDQAKQRRLARRLRLMLLAIVVIVAIIAGIVVLGLLAVAVGIGIGAAVVIGGLIAMGRTFYVQQKHVFQMLHRGEQREKRSAVTVRNLRSAMRDLRRQVEAYGQLQIWARVVAAFLTAPFGRTVSSDDNQLAMSGPFPRGMSIGDIVASKDAIEAVVAELRRDIFAVGWLSAPWDALLAGAAHLVGPSAPDPPDSPRALYNKPSSAWTSETESFLAIWGSAVANAGASTDAGDAVWKSISESLHGSRSSLARMLTSQIEVSGPSRHQVNVDDFMAGIDAVSDAPTFFDAEILSDSAATRRLHEVTTEVRTSENVGLARVASLVQFTADIPHYDFRGGTSPAAPGHRASSPSPPLDTQESSGSNDEVWSPPSMPGLGEWTRAGDRPVQGPDSSEPAPEGTSWTFGGLS